HPAEGLGVAVACDEAVPDEAEADVARPLNDVELRAGVELHDRLIGGCHRGVLHHSSSSRSSSSRASQVASRSIAASNSGCRSTKVRSWSESHCRLTSSSPRRVASSSMPRSVKYTAAD